MKTLGLLAVVVIGGGIIVHHIYFSQTNSASVRAEHESIAGMTEIAEGVAGKNTVSDIGDATTAFSAAIRGKEPSTERVATEATEQIRYAKQAVLSNNLDKRIEGMLYLSSADPKTAAESIPVLLDKMNESPDVQGAAILGVLRLAKNSEALPDEKLVDYYHNYQNDNVKGRIARVLSFRGNDELLKDYITNVENQMQSSDPEQLVTQLRKLEALDSQNSIDAIKPHLSNENEHVRLAALNALTRSGNLNDLELLRPMLDDPSSIVQMRAEMAMNYFLDIGLTNPTPSDILITAMPGDMTNLQ